MKALAIGVHAGERLGYVGFGNLSSLAPAKYTTTNLSRVEGPGVRQRDLVWSWPFYTQPEVGSHTLLKPAALVAAMTAGITNTAMASATS